MASAFTLFGELKADTGGFKNSLREAEARLKATERAIAQTEKKAQSIGKTSATTARGFEKLNEKVGETRARLTASVAAFNRGEIGAKQLTASLNRTSTALGSVTSRVKDMSARLSDSAQKTGSFAQKMGLTVVAANLASTAFLSLTSNLSQGAAAIFNYSSRLQTATVSLTNLTGSASNAKLIVTELQKLARSSPFEFAGLQTAAVRLAGVGVSTEKLLPLMRDLGNIVAATGDTSAERFEGIATALSQMISKTRLSAEEMEQLAERGVPAWKLLSEATGQPIAELRKLSEQGKLTADVMVNALSRLGQTKYGDAMAQQSRTATGAWNVLVNALTQDLSTAFAPVFRELSAQLAKYADGVKNSTAETETWARTTSNVLAGVIESWKTATSAVEAYLIAQGLLTKKQEESVSWSRALLASGGLGELFYSTGEAANEAAENLEAYNNALKGVTEYGRTFRLDTVTNTIQEVGATIDRAAANTQKSGLAMMTNLQAGILQGKPLVTEAMRGAVTEAGAQSEAKASSAGSQVGSSLMLGLINGIASRAGAAIAAAESVMTRIVAIIKAIPIIRSPSAVTTYFGEMIVEGLIVGMKNKADAAVKTARDLTEDVIHAMEKAGEGVTTRFGMQIETGFGHTPETAGSLDNGGGGAQGQIEPLITAAQDAEFRWTGFFDMFRQRMAELKSSLPSFKSLIQENLINSISQIGDVFANAVTQWDGTARGFFKSIASGFADMARQIIAQLIRIAVMQAVLKLIGAFAGAAHGGSAAGPGAGGVITGGGGAIGSNGGGFLGGLGGFGNLLGGLGTPLKPAFAGGGSSVTNYNDTKTNNFNFTMPGMSGNGLDQRTKTQLINEITAAIRRQEMRNK